MRKLIKRYLNGAQVPRKAEVTKTTAGYGVDGKALLAIDRAMNYVGSSGGKMFQGAGGWGQGLAMIGDIGSSFIPHKEQAELTESLNSAYDAASTAVMSLGPWGMLAGGIMKAGGLLADGLTAMGVGTDGVTTTDQILDSKFLKLTPTGLVNATFASKLASRIGGLDVDDALALSSGGYGGFLNVWDEAGKYSGKKVGFFNSKSGLNEKVYNANRQMHTLQDIMGKRRDQLTLTALMEDRWNLATENNMNGGIGNIMFGRLGLKVEILPKVHALLNKPKVLDTLKEWEENKNNDGGIIDSFLKGGKPEYKKVKSDKAYYDKDSDIVYYTNDEDLIHEGFHARPDSALLELLRPYYENLNDEKILNFGGNLLFVKRFEGDPGHFYSPEELGARISAAKFRTKGNNYTPEFFKYLRTNENLYGDNMRDLLYMYNDENLSKIFNIGNTQAFKQGGQMNVIPEGSLHARLHHMENADGLTKKGIPVVSIAEGGELELQAEIELNEIIFNLEVTTELEKLMLDGSDNAAIEAGKLLVKEIFENTDDRTGLIKLLEPEKKEPTTEDIVKNHQVFLTGGTLPTLKTIEELVDYAIKLNPAFVLRIGPNMGYAEYIDENGKTLKGTHLLNYAEDNGEYVVYPEILMENGRLQYEKDWKKAFDKAKRVGNVIRFRDQSDAEKFTKEYKKSRQWKHYFDTWNLRFGSFKNGGIIEKINTLSPEQLEKLNKFLNEV